jgi:hypothetical protein
MTSNEAIIIKRNNMLGYSSKRIEGSGAGTDFRPPFSNAMSNTA